MNQYKIQINGAAITTTTVTLMAPNRQAAEPLALEQARNGEVQWEILDYTPESVELANEEE
jgi:anti-sigma factor ChrR (cupin superfamily)